MLLTLRGLATVFEVPLRWPREGLEFRTRKSPAAQWLESAKRPGWFRSAASSAWSSPQPTRSAREWVVGGAGGRVAGGPPMRDVLGPRAARAVPPPAPPARGRGAKERGAVGRQLVPPFCSWGVSLEGAWIHKKTTAVLTIFKYF